MLDNAQELWKIESDARKARANRDANKLKLHRIVLENIHTGTRETRTIAGWDFDRDLTYFKVLLQRQGAAKDFYLAEQTGNFTTIDVWPEYVLKELCFITVPRLSTKEKQQILEYLKKDLKEE